MDVGEEVEVRTHYTGSWSAGFSVVEIVPHGYVIRRRSDGGILPAVIPAAEVRASSGHGSSGAGPVEQRERALEEPARFR
jgi:hypothetical protein